MASSRTVHNFQGSRRQTVPVATGAECPQIRRCQETNTPTWQLSDSKAPPGVSGAWSRPISGGDGVGVCPGAEPHSLLSFIVLHCQGAVFPTRRHGCCLFIFFWLLVFCRVSLVVFPKARNNIKQSGATPNPPASDPHPTRILRHVARGDAAPSRRGPAPWHRERCVCPTPDGP